MANADHFELLMQGVDAWNAWRAKEPSVKPDLSRASLADTNLSGANLRGVDLHSTYFNRANLSEADLSRADLRGTFFVDANLSGANLRRANLVGANFREANLVGADLRGAWLAGANLDEARLGEARLAGANFQRASLVQTDLSKADLTGCRIYGMSAWDLNLEGAKQKNLIITREDQAEITVDNIEVAQFIYLLLHNEKIRDVIETITSKAVLILGRFTPERKAVLDALRDELRRRNYLPVVFDFEKPSSQTTDETITLLARMARFVIADLSDAKSVLQELRGIVPDLPSVAVQPLILIPQEEPGMFDFFSKYPWFLEPYRYDSQDHLLANLDGSVVDPAEAKVLKLRGAPG